MRNIKDILKQMEDDEIVFKTAGGRKPLKIRNVDIRNNCFCFERSTGKVSWPLSIDKFEDTYNLVVQSDIELTYKDIDKIIPTFGNYAMGLIYAITFNDHI